MRRRDFLTLVGASAAGWPMQAMAQQSNRMRRMFVILGIAENDPEAQDRIKALRQGLRDRGWLEGSNIELVYRFAAGDPGLVKTYVEEAMGAAPDLIHASSSPVLAALKQASQSIPIVFAVVNDPLGQGFITSLARPGGNITGFTFIEYPMFGKWLDILTEIAPDISRAGLLFNPITAPFFERYLRSFAADPSNSSVQLSGLPVVDPGSIDAAIAGLALAPRGGLLVPPELSNLLRREVILAAIERHRIPAVQSYRQFVVEGALISYGPDAPDIFRRSASYVDQILKGTAPGDLPVQSPEKFELCINLKTARSQGFNVSRSLLASADLVIE